MPRRRPYRSFWEWLIDFLWGLPPDAPSLNGRPRYLRQDDSMLIYAQNLTLDNNTTAVRARITQTGNISIVPLVKSADPAAVAGDYEFGVQPGDFTFAAAAQDVGGVWSAYSADVTGTAVLPPPPDNGPAVPVLNGSFKFLRVEPDPAPATTPISAPTTDTGSSTPTDAGTTVPPTPAP